MKLASMLGVFIILNIAGCAAPIPAPESAAMVPKKLNMTVPRGTSIYVENPALDSAAAEGTTPFDQHIGKFPFVQQQGLENYRESIRLALIAAGAESPPNSGMKNYVLRPIILGGVSIPFPEAYSILFVRYQLEEGKTGEIAWSTNVYSQAKLEKVSSAMSKSGTPHPAYARLAAANLRQMVMQLSEWLTVNQQSHQ
jgi:hypothetical protein